MLIKNVIFYGCQRRPTGLSQTAPGIRFMRKGKLARQMAPPCIACFVAGAAPLPGWKAHRSGRRPPHYVLPASQHIRAFSRCRAPALWRSGQAEYPSHPGGRHDFIKYYRIFLLKFYQQYTSDNITCPSLNILHSDIHSNLSYSSLNHYILLSL